VSWNKERRRGKLEASPAPPLIVSSNLMMFKVYH
jgi:hypothetical protein